MKRYTTVENAVKLAVEILVKNHMPFDVARLRNCILSWYNHSDVTNIEILAACALEGKDWYPGATYEDMLTIYDDWFTVDYDEAFPVWEIEAAQRDALWR